MVEYSYSLNFQGYWRHVNSSFIPNIAGIYCVYTCINSVYNNSLLLRKLVYIGQSEYTQSRIISHEKYNDWKREINIHNNEELCFSIAPVTPTRYINDRELFESALVNLHKPICNDLLPGFPQGIKIRLFTTGSNYFLLPDMLYPK